jgi:calcium-binding protein CML
LDKDADGRISPAELRLCVRASLGEEVPAEALVASADADGAEFVRLVAGVEAAEEERRRGRHVRDGGAGLHHARQPQADA